MSLFTRLEMWSQTRHPKWLVLLRVILGLLLFQKGVFFLFNTSELDIILNESNIFSNTSWLALVIPWIHILGGFLIISGLFTRIATLVQIPILLGAVIFVNASRGIFSANSELSLSLIVLAMLIFFFVEGGGPISLDQYFHRNPV